MGRRRSSSSYNATPQAALPPPVPAAAPAVPTAVSSVRSLLSMLMPPNSPAAVPFKLPALPVDELFGGISNTARGLVLNGNWWIALLIIFLFFPNISHKMFGGLFKD